MITKKRILLTFVAASFAFVISLNCFSAMAQSETTFSPTDRFSISSQNGEIGFEANGTYTDAILMNETWAFVGLQLNGSQPLQTLKVSTQNSRVRISSFRAGNTTLRSSRLRYIAEGRGEQTFNIGIAAGEGRWGLHPEWSVIVDGVWLGEGDGWEIAPDGTVTVKGAVGNVSIVHYDFLAISGNYTNLPFHEQHSVAIATVVVSVSLVAFLVTIFRIKTKGDKADSSSGEFTNNISQSERGD